MVALQSFAGVMLTLVPIVATFMSESIQPDHELYDHVRCIWRLHLIIGILSLGPHKSMQYVNRLRTLVVEHAELFVMLYPNSVRPKFHHLFHIADNMVWLGCLLSCFVCERKHRETKRAALWTFRSIDNTVAKELLSRQCARISAEGTSLFQKQWLHSPKALNFGGVVLSRSTSACLECGPISATDMVWVQEGASVIVGRVEAFWECHGQINVELRRYQRADAHGTRWSSTNATTTFVSVEYIVDAMAFADLGDSIVLVIPPCMPQL